jgi:mRNA interferase MazF
VNEGDVILTFLPQADGKLKHRPAVVLRQMPLYGDFLVCGVSTQMNLMVSGFDEPIIGKDDDFAGSGLMADSLIRLGFLAVLPRKNIVGSIGTIARERHRRLLQRLSDYLLKNQTK